MRRGRLFCSIAAGLLATGVMITPALAGKVDNSVRIATQRTIANIDPYYNQTSSARSIADAVWDTLIYRDPETGEYEGNLATDWRWVDDKTLELDLRQGVRFHNRAQFDADDVLYTLSFVSRPESGAVYVSLVRWIDRVEKLDRYKVRIVAKQPFPAAIAYLAAPNLV